MAAVLSETNEVKRFGGAEAVKAFVAARAASAPEEHESLLGRAFDRLRAAPLDPAIDVRMSELGERVELCMERQRETTDTMCAELEAQRRQLGEQRLELHDWLHDGLSVVQRRLDEAAQTHHDTAEAQMKVTAEAIALCSSDIEGLVAAVRALAAQARMQDERLADAAIAANLKLRQDVEVSSWSVRSALGSQKRRTERVERVVTGALAEQRRFTTRMVVALGVVQVLGLTAVVVFG
ncbi:MAG: hypothetical protein NTW15_04830 [Burkholderiales bacterium]|nr:hypothetical protein [Burkholderiales bacterium]